MNRQLRLKIEKVKLLAPDERDNVIFFSALKNEPLPIEFFMEECDDCEGHGTAACKDCDGDGKVECTCRECDNVHETDCDTCRGKGHLGPCNACDGAGAVDTRDERSPAPVGAPVLPGLEAWCA